jgi:SAM-dependent methyltransferase
MPAEDKSLLGQLSDRMKQRRARKRMDSRDDLHEFWRQPAPDGNVPSAYIEPVHRSRALVRLIADLPRSARILEIGCNVGRNLAHLHDQGYTDVSGIEINPNAVELLRATFPQLADRPIFLGPAEEQLAKLGTDDFDLVFTMAVIEHIHPDSSALFEQIVRVGHSVLCIEPRGNSSHRQFPHDVPAIFTKLGLELRATTPMSELPETADDPAVNKYVAWRFVR